MGFKIEVSEKNRKPSGRRGIAIVAATFYQQLSEEMILLALRTAKEQGVEVVQVMRVPGAYDTPLAVKRLLLRDDVVGVVTLGSVVEGQTAHDKVIMSATVKTLQELALRFDKPVSLGINGPGMSMEGAKARVKRAKDATLACIALLPPQ